MLLRLLEDMQRDDKGCELNFHAKRTLIKEKRDDKNDKIFFRC
jgi:hypothetical protein